MENDDTPRMSTPVDWENLPAGLLPIFGEAAYFNPALKAVGDRLRFGRGTGMHDAEWAISQLSEAAEAAEMDARGQHALLAEIEAAMRWLFDLQNTYAAGSPPPPFVGGPQPDDMPY